jgi:haloalkane dehalogenase
MAYVEVGSGDPIVLLHGNPTSSYLWRNIIPYLEVSVPSNGSRKDIDSRRPPTGKAYPSNPNKSSGNALGRCIAPDLIGMGDSEKLPDSGPGSYTFVEHRRYLDALFDLLGIKERVTFVVHDWGSALAFDWTYRHPDAVKGIAYMEAIVKPGSWSEMTETARQVFQAYRSPAGEQMILQENRFIEFNLPNTILRHLTEEEMDHYRRPFAEPGEGRRPTLSWPRQLPIDGEPADVTEIVTTYGEWLSQSSIPKFFIHCAPGAMAPSALEFCRSWPAQSEITVRGRHYPQEDSPDEVGQALANWVQTLQ